MPGSAFAGHAFDLNAYQGQVLLPGYDRHPNENWLAVPICHLTKLALFGQHRVYLPLVIKQ
jgi:hypothetical protein